VTHVPTVTADRAGPERVVLCGPDGAATGTALKAAVHGPDTPLHLAFSCYVFDPDANLLVTRRAFGKRTFPGVRTNTCCGHPSPGESMTDAIRRRTFDELGVVIAELTLILPRFRYRAVAADGTVENELCPLYRAVVTSPALDPDPTEVDAAWWVPWAQFAGGDDADDPRSAWSREQVEQLRQLGPDPLRWVAGDPMLLPAAARE
jgi:isopentenyl-diphosphate delta-isomerase